MKKLLVLTAMLCLYFQAITVSAATPDFSGDWELDVAKSKLPETVKVESSTKNVVQTPKDIKIETVVKKSSEPVRGIRRGGEKQTVVYNLDGAETKSEIGSDVMAGSEARSAKITTDGKLSLTVKRSFKTEMGGGDTKINETWELLDNGKTLKVVRYIESTRGGVNWEMYFTKKSSDSGKPLTGNTTSAGRISQKGEPFDISNFTEGGILNFSAYSLTPPEYPKAARAVRAEGVVLIKVTVDEKGEVTSATATSGHLLLRQAAEEAAQKAKFNPPTNQGKPSKVTGVLIYNFVG